MQSTDSQQHQNPGYQMPQSRNKENKTKTKKKAKSKRELPIEPDCDSKRENADLTNQRKIPPT
jgi:hypothetical protein